MEPPHLVSDAQLEDIALHGKVQAVTQSNPPLTLPRQLLLPAPPQAQASAGVTCRPQLRRNRPVRMHVALARSMFS
jgi:hypothetical protein